MSLLSTRKLLWRNFDLYKRIDSGYYSMLLHIFVQKTTLEFSPHDRPGNCSGITTFMVQETALALLHFRPGNCSGTITSYISTKLLLKYLYTTLNYLKYL